MKVSKILLTLLVVVFLVSSVAVRSTTPASPVPEELKIGMITTLTGAGALWGLNYSRGAKYAIDDINKEGGIVAGGKRYTLKFILEDDKYTPQDAINAANKLVFTEKVNIIMGPLPSSAALATGPIFERNKVLNLFAAYATQMLAPGRNLYSFRILGFLPALSSPAMVSKFVELFPNVKTVATICIDDETGRASLDPIKASLQATGIQIIDESLYPRGTKEHRPVATRAITKKPDAIWTSASPAEDVSLQVKELRLLGYKGPIWSASTMSAEYLIRIAGAEAAEGFTSGWFDLLGKGSPPEVVALAKRYSAEFGAENLDVTVLVYYGAVIMLKKAIEMTGSVDPTQLRDQFLKEDIEWPCIWGGPAFMKNRQILHPILFATMKEGRGVNYLAYPQGYPEGKKRK